VSDVNDLRLAFSDDIRGDSPIFVRCPYHGDKIRPNLAIYADHGMCYACGKYVRPLSLIQQLKGVTLEEAQNLLADLPTTVVLEQAEVRLDPIPEGIVEQYQKQLKEEKQALGYLKKRGLLPKTVTDAKLGYTGWAYTIPVYCNGELKNIKFRRDDAKPYNPKSPKYWGLPHRKTELYNGDIIENGGIIVLTEGELDALVASQLDGYQGVSLTQGANSPLCDTVVSKLAVAKTIIIAYDKDVASFNIPLRLAPQLKHPDTRIAMWPPSIGKDVSEIWVNKGKTTLENVLANARKWKSEV
jgi:DNA primase